MSKICDAPDCDNFVNGLLGDYCSTTCENVDLEIKGELVFGNSEDLSIEEIRERHEAAQRHINERIDQGLTNE